jgi:hypothetical protein
MPWLSTTLLGLTLAAIAAGLMFHHWRAWRRVRDDAERPEPERRFAWRQFRRRMQTSGMIGLAGLGMLAGQFIRAPLLLVFFWAGVMLLLLWVVLLALADVIATQQHFGAARRQNLSEQTRAQAELRRWLDARPEAAGEEPSE